MTKRRIRRAVTALKTRVTVTDIFDGTDKLCAERYGFKTAGGKTFSHLAVSTRCPIPGMVNTGYAMGLPAIGGGLLMTRFGQSYKWNYEDDRCVGLGNVNNVKPFVVECSVDGENAYTLFGGSKLGLLKKDSQSFMAIAYKLYCGTFHYGRVFARDYNDPYLIRWSAYGTTDWSLGPDKGGHVRLNTLGGEVVGMVSYGKKLLIIRKNAVCVMHAFGDARGFSIEQSEAHAVPDVTPFTSVICGGQLWFYTEEGLYCFNGSSLSRKPLPDYIRGYEITFAMSVGGRYIYFNMSKGDLPCFLEYDVREDSFTRFAEGGYLISEMKDKMHCFYDDYVVELAPDVGNDGYFWKSVSIDLGTGKCKTVKRLIAEGEGNLTFEIDCDGRTHSVNGFGSTVVGERAESFTFTVRGVGSLKRLTAEWEVNV